MAKHKIIWSTRARRRLYAILEFYNDRNKSKSYSIKLFRLITKEVNLLQKYPDLGLKTTDDSIRGLIIESYIVFYEVNEDLIAIHSIWDCRQDPSSKIIK